MNSDLVGKQGGIATLELAEIGCPMTVRQVEAPASSPEWKSWLEEIGFVAGERVHVMARAVPGGDPLVVRVGQSTFALRRAEAACVRVIPVESKVNQGLLVDELLNGGLA